MAGQTARAFSEPTGTKRLLNSSEGPVATAGAVTVSWTVVENGRWATIAAAVAPAASAPARRPVMESALRGHRLELAGIIGPSRGELTAQLHPPMAIRFTPTFGGIAYQMRRFLCMEGVRGWGN